MNLISLLTKHPVLVVLGLLAASSSKKETKKSADVIYPSKSVTENINNAVKEFGSIPWYLVFAVNPKKAKTLNAIRNLKKEKGTDFRVPITNDISKDLNQSLQGVWVGNQKGFIKSNISLGVPMENGETALVYMEPKVAFPNFPNDVDAATPEYYELLLQNREKIFENLPLVADILSVGMPQKMPTDIFIVK